MHLIQELNPISLNMNENFYNENDNGTENERQKCQML